MNFVFSHNMQIFVLVTIVLFFLYKLSTRNFDYWKKKNVPYVRPLPIVGNFLDVFLFRTTIGHLLAKFYKKFQTPYFGIYILNQPYLIIRSPELIKSILVRDFNHFYDRTIFSDEKCDSIASHALFASKNPEWKTTRTKITPVFTTGKVKNMLGLINNVANELTNYIRDNMVTNSIEAKEMCSKYTTDAVVSCAFGIEANSFKYDNAQFREVGRKMFDFRWETVIRHSLYFLSPGLVKLFGISIFEPKMMDFLRNVFWETIKERERTGQKRNDLIDIIIQMKKQSATDDNMKFEGDMVVAQAVQFFGAGFETTSTTLSFTFYELCLSPEIQNKLRSEVTNVLAQHGELTYEAIHDMKYLHLVVCETLRKYPVLPFLDRMCMADYKIPNSDLIIEKGTPVYIPMFGLHHDPEFFPDPEKYDPERFFDERRCTIPNFSYIPFGEGPRICIGERFGLLVTKVGIACVISKFELEATADTPVPLKFQTKSLFLAPTSGLQMKFKPIVTNIN